MLTSANDELLDLAQASPELTLSGSGAPTGIRLLKMLGAGGMSTVFQAELDSSRRSAELAPETPSRLAIKMTQPSAVERFKALNIDHRALIRKEWTALARVMDHKPPTEFVIGVYGGAESDVLVRGKKVELPWIAIEYVDGGAAGSSLLDRVKSAREGIDPPRCLRLVRGIIEGVRTLHEVGAIHRDLKPENVLVAGPIDDETPKIADFGIARVAGVHSGTFNAFSVHYAGLEQLHAVPGEFNPLIGPWTDVHALATLIWFILAGEPWCRGANDTRFLFQGARRGLNTSGGHLHPGFFHDPALLGRLDEALARGAAARLPPEAEAASHADSKSAQLYTAMSGRLPPTERFASVKAFADVTVPLLEAAEARWKERVAGENRAATAFRPTMMVDVVAGREAPVRIIERPPGSIHGSKRQLGSDFEPVDARNFVFQPDGKVLARFGSELLYFVGDQVLRVAVEPELQPALDRSRWLCRGAGSGFAVVGTAELLLLRGGRFLAAELPKREGAVGEVQAVYGDGRVFGIVTAGTDDSDDSPEFWQTSDGTTWSAPRELSIRGEIRAIASGPFGFFAVGAASNGKSARAVHLGFNGQVMTMPWVKALGPLDLVVCSATWEAWAAGDGVLVRLERDAAIPEKCEAAGKATALALDLSGQPWLVTGRAVYRRQMEGPDAVWRRLYERGPGRPALVGIGFTPAGAHVFDEAAGIVDIEPHDIASWRQKTP